MAAPTQEHPDLGRRDSRESPFDRLEFRGWTWLFVRQNVV